jgi:putative ABC transport system permease protein
LVAAVRPGAAAAVGEYALRQLDPTAELGLSDVTPPDGRILLTNVTSDLRTIGIALGGFVGFVGMIMVANTMSMTVSQRSRELGLRGALGWSPTQIRVLILAESAIAGLVAAIIGAGIGTAVAWGWAGWHDWLLVNSPTLAPLLIAAGTAASILGGLIPANHAATISPMTAMRS